jgi:hypothetical protein
MYNLTPYLPLNLTPYSPHFVILSEAKNPAGFERQSPSGFFASLRMTKENFAQNDKPQE